MSSFSECYLCFRYTFVSTHFVLHSDVNIAWKIKVVLAETGLKGLSLFKNQTKENDLLQPSSELTDYVYIFWQKKIGKKAAFKILVKLTIQHASKTCKKFSTIHLFCPSAENWQRWGKSSRGTYSVIQTLILVF